MNPRSRDNESYASSFYSTPMFYPSRSNTHNADSYDAAAWTSSGPVGITGQRDYPISSSANSFNVGGYGWQSAALPSITAQPTTFRSLDSVQNTNSGPIELQHTAGPKSKRRKHNPEEWALQLPRIHKFYIDDDLTLRETMQRMKSTYNFVASERKYKDVLIEQGWRKNKNLSLTMATYMLHKSHERQEVPTDWTLFDEPVTLEKAEDTIKKSRSTGKYPVASQTPIGLKYWTPEYHNAGAPTPNLTETLLTQQLSTPVPGAHSAIPGYLPLLWHDQRIDDFAKIWGEAQEAEEDDNLELAESKYREALAGYEVLQSPTSDDRLEIGYRLANICAKQGNMRQADEVLEHMNKSVAPHWGLSHPRLEEHYLKICNLFRSWKRDKDAHLFARRLGEATNCFDAPNASLMVKVHPHRSSRLTLSQMNELDSKADDISRQLGRIARQLTYTPSIITPNDMQSAITNVISQCQKADPKPYLQLLEAGVLLGRISGIVNVDNAQNLRDHAADICLGVLNDRKTITRESLHAAIKVASQLIGVTNGASCVKITTILECISTKAEALFGFAHFDYILVLFSIGQAYASCGVLRRAKQWIEHAMSATMSLVGCSGCSNCLVATLQVLRESRCPEDFERHSVEFQSVLEKLQHRGSRVFCIDGSGNFC